MWPPPRSFVSNAGLTSVHFDTSVKSICFQPIALHRNMHQHRYHSVHIPEQSVCALNLICNKISILCVLFMTHFDKFSISVSLLLSFAFESSGQFSNRDMATRSSAHGKMCLWWPANYWPTWILLPVLIALKSETTAAGPVIIESPWLEK